MKRRKAPLITAAIAIGILILDSRNAVAAAAEGIDLCLKTVIPSLFPFFVLSIFLTGNLGDAPFLRPVCRLFRVEYGAQGVLISGLLGGYPVGAQAAAEAWKNGKLTKQSAEHLLMFCSQAGPSFLFGMVASQFPEAKYGWMLWAVQIMSAWGVSQLIPPSTDQISGNSKIQEISFPEAMKKAISAMSSVCGWVIQFRVILNFLGRWLFDFFPETIFVPFSGLLEVTNGCLLLNTISSISERFFLAVFLLNFGGICVLMQTASVTAGLDLKYYIRGKTLQSMFSLCFSLSMLGKWSALLAFAGIFLLIRRRNLQKNSSNPAVVGV